MVFIEKLIIGLTTLVVLAAAGGVGFFSVYPKGTGVSHEQVGVDAKVLRWLDTKRGRTKHGIIHVERVDLTAAPTSSPGKSSGGPSGKSKAPATPAARKKAAVETATRSLFSSGYFADGDAFPEDEQVPGIPWIRREPGVEYYAPEPIPASLYQRYQAIDSAVELMKETRGKFLKGPNGSTFKLDGLAEGSYLKSIAGLEPGDELISVNGIRIQGVGLTAAKQVYNQVKDAKHFAVKVLRRGRPTVLTFTVK